MVALGLSTFLGYFVRLPPRPPYALDNLRCRATGHALGMRDVADATSLIPNTRPAALHLKLSRAYGGRGGTLTKYPRKVECPRATMAVHKLLSWLSILFISVMHSQANIR